MPSMKRVYLAAVALGLLVLLAAGGLASQRPTEAATTTIEVLLTGTQEVLP